MKAIYISGTITDDTVNNFISEFNKIHEDEQITIYINSTGGLIDPAMSIADIINKNYQRIEIVACGYIYSSAFYLFFLNKCKRRLLENTVGMVHYARLSVEFTQEGKPYYEDGNFLIKEMKRSKFNSINQLKLAGLNKKEIDIIKKSKDCYFTYPRLKQLLKYAEKNR